MWVDPEDAVPTVPVLSAVPVRKPGPNDFIRVRPGADWQRRCYIAEWEGDTYYIPPEFYEPLEDVARPVLLRTAITNRGHITFLWPIKIMADGPGRMWMETAVLAAELAETRWVRMKGDTKLGGYQIRHAQDDLGEPKWHDVTMSELLRIAFRGRVVDSIDYPIIRALRGIGT